MRRNRYGSLAVLFFVLASVASGQEPAWRVITGDNPAFAQPEFDDSGWAAGTVPKPGEAWVAGVRWYRATFAIPESWRGRPLAVGMGPLSHAYEVYVEGTRIGQFGSWSPKQVVYAVRHESLQIPAELTRKGQVHVAIRRFTRQIGTGWTIHSIAGGTQYPHSPAVGPAAQIAETERLHGEAGFTQLAPNIFLNLVSWGCGLLCLGLYASQRKHREFLWLGVGLTGRGLTMLAGILEGVTYGFPMFGVAGTGLVIVSNLTSAWLTLGLAELVPREASRSKRFLFFAGASIGAALTIHTLLHRADSGWFFFETVSWVGAFQLLATLWAAAICFRARRFESASLCATVALAALAGILTGARGVTFQVAGVRVAGALVRIGSFTIGLANVAFPATALVMTYILWRRFRREQARLVGLETDLRAARTVQQLLFTGDAPGVEAVYQPASEVGGDFYQVLPLEDGSQLIAVGDVSGKGLRAAMVVAMVVGSLRMRRNLSPGRLLEEINGQLLGTMNGGFVTCLLVRLEGDGRAILANAGHLGPYSAGSEVVVETGLPLGIMKTEYLETTGSFESLMLLSDGVVEAMNASGELFGFERTRALSGQSAAEIAQAAIAWGQNDDITVVTVGRVV